MTRLVDIYWIAGLLEGEGCFYSSNPRMKPHHKTTTFTIKLTMTDRDTVVKAGKILRSDDNGLSTGYWAKHTSGGKITYTIRVSGKVAISWMMTIYSLMSDRRKAKIKSLVDEWKLYSTKHQPAFQG